MNNFLRFAALILISLSGTAAWSYPNFIGYSYTTCITCHYNPQGHGPLNDYGRAIFAQEIAARPFIPKRIDDEVLAERSGFIPGKELPSWLRPGLKYRGLWFKTDPGSTASIEKYFAMQTEVNLALHDEDQKYVFVATWNQLHEERDLWGKGEPVQDFFRELYLRFRIGARVYLSAGLFDKVYGIRTVDHTSYSRARIGLGQYDQTHGLAVMYAGSSWDVTLHLQAGHQQKVETAQHKGVSLQSEFEIGEQHRLGFSLLSTSTEGAAWNRAAIHDRWGFVGSPGTSLMWEFGMVQNTIKATETTKTGTYALVETLVHLTRGYNLLSSVERFQEEVKSSSPESYRWTLGFLTFPFQRTEFRATMTNVKNYSLDSSNPDSWLAQGQLHVSF